MSALEDGATSSRARMIALWEDLLGLEGVDPEDDFFALGGDSILSIVLRDRARSLGFAFSAADLFRNPTVNGLLSITETELDSATANPLDDAKRDQVSSAPLSMFQELIYWEAQESASQARWCIQEMYTLNGVLDIAALRTSINSLASRHHVLRSSASYDTSAGTPQLAWPPVGSPVVHIADAATDRLSAELDYQKRQAFSRIGLEHGPLVDFAVVRESLERWHLIFTVHHVISDGWSHGILRQELFRDYGRALEGVQIDCREDNEQIRLPLGVDTSTEQTGKYWSDYLSPRDNAGVPVSASGNSGASSEISRLLTKLEWQALKQQAKATRSTPNAVVLSFLMRTIAEVASTSDACILTLRSGRERLANVEGSVGCFVQVLPIFVSSVLSRDFGDLCKAIHAEEVVQREFSGVSYDQLLSAAGEVGSLEDLSNVLLAFQSFPDQDPHTSVHNSKVVNLESYESSERRWMPIEITCFDSMDGGLSLTCRFDPSRFSEMLPFRFFDAFVDRLKNLDEGDL